MIPTSPFNYKLLTDMPQLITINLSLEFPEYHYSFDDDGDNDGSISIITVNLNSTNPDSIVTNYVNGTSTGDPFEDVLSKDTGVHFLTEQMHDLATKQEGNKDEGKEGTKGKHVLLEYYLRTDGRVICKMCGEVLPSRTHWYRHKYKRHAAQPTNPAPLFQCEQCFS